MKYTALIVLWSLWCIGHSGLISVTSNERFRTRCGRHYRLSRLAYNLVALMTLIPLLRYGDGLKGPVLFRWGGSASFVRWLLLASAGALFIAGGLKYDMLRFLGIRQITSGQSHTTLSEGGKIDTSGVLGLTRHPWYLATILFVWAGQREVYASTLIVNVLLTIYVVVGTLLEERRLIGEFGDSYRHYRQRASMLFPTKWVMSKLRIVNGRDSIGRR